jgi:hypothetical protein
MTMRTSRKAITFRRPFSLSGIDDVQPAGTYTVEINEELIEGLSFPSWRRTATVLLLRQPGTAGIGQDVEIDPLELEAVQDGDALELPEAVIQASLGDLLTDGVLQQAVHSAGLSPSGFKTFLHELSKRIDVARRERQASA